MESYNDFFIFLGAMFLIIVVAYIIHKRSTQKHHPQNIQQTLNNPDIIQKKQQSQEETKRMPPQQTVYDPIKQEQRKLHLNSLVQGLKHLCQNQIWDLSDLIDNVDESLNREEVEYLAKQLPTSIFSTTIWDLHLKIINYQLSDDNIIKILDSGTDSIIQTFIGHYRSNMSWNISYMLLDKLLSKHSLLVFSFTNYRKENLQKIIDKLSVSELLGYRVKANHGDEAIQDSFTDFKQELEIDFYESVDDNIIHYLEANYPTEVSLRKIAFTKLVSDSPNMICVINSVNDLSEDEIKQIIARGYSPEIDALFSSFDSNVVANCFSASYAVKVVLQLVECDYQEEIENNYDFSSIDADTYKQIINSLSADELLGYDDRGSAHYDIIKLFEDHSVDDDIRKLAFTKILESTHFSHAIERWDNVTEEEIGVIMERKNEEEIEALFGRNDSEDLICNLPEEVAIKISLELIYPDSSETIRDNYSFGDNEAFIKVINELSAGELLGFRSDPEGSESFSNDADYDIIKLIEDQMNDDSTLRDLAFAKMCGYKDMSEAIARWEFISQEETEKIINRSIEKEMSALMERDDFDTSNLPDNFVIKQYLLDDDSIRDEYTNRIDDQDFRQKVERMVKVLSSKKLSAKDKESNVEDLSDDIIIKAELQLFDLDECSFDSDDISGEFSDRVDNPAFKQKIQELVAQLS